MSQKRHHPPSPADDRELKRTVIAAVAQGLVREALAFMLGRWGGGHW